MRHIVMLNKFHASAWLAAALLGASLGGQVHAETAVAAATPLVIGESFNIASKALGETRHINVYMSRGYALPADAPLPVLYMPDGGLREDFLHIAGLLQVSVDNGTMRPFMLVGIENTQRRRDMTGPTDNAEDKKIAPVVGGAAHFRRFIREELMPAVKQRYRTTGETALIGESLAGLFVVETFLREPGLFDHYIAIDPSLWWNDGKLLNEAPTLLDQRAARAQSFYFASSGTAGMDKGSAQLSTLLTARAPQGLRWHYQPLPAETQATIYQPAALQAFRTMFKPPN
ncbi:alpha/beta hydrolase [Duganella sp. BJB1802]|uniref:alpha/beta hydrolase n=1 Tax=Duganella sp. BJB1802 TaxID=2744575 RepID=UPI001593939A|nr:alpha/beta hydrolase-fold protein [Duganella sp. BJB1802]NVD69975.1 alpha/beta hydrolase [Duganella sp. BJB1802]